MTVKTFISLLAANWPLEVPLLVVVIGFVIVFWPRLKRISIDIGIWIYFVWIVVRSKFRNKILRRWHEESWINGYLQVFYDCFLILKEKQRYRHFKYKRDKRRGYRTYRESNTVVMEFFHGEYNADVRARAYLEALQKASEWNEPARDLGYGGLELIVRHMVARDLFSCLKKSDKIALEERVRKQRRKRRFEPGLKKLMDYFEESLKGRNLTDLDQGIKYIILRELRKRLIRVQT